MNTLEETINGLNLKFEAECVENRPDGVNWGQYHFRIRMRCGSHRMTIYWSQGSARPHSPTLADVLDCLASDAASYENARDFAEFTFEMGYNATESGLREAERIYKMMRKQSAQLRRLLGKSVYKALLWDTEKL